MELTQIILMYQTLVMSDIQFIVPVNSLKFSSGLFMCQINEILWTFKLADKKCSTYIHILRKIASVRAIETLHLPIDKNQTSRISQGTLTQNTCYQYTMYILSMWYIHLLKLNYYKQVFFPHPFICMRNFINKKVLNRRN